jgi:plastocyanin
MPPSGASGFGGSKGAELKRFLFVVIVSGLAFASVAYGATTQIGIGDDFFSPDAPAVQKLSAGASFHWQRTSGNGRHNVREDSKIFYSGSATTGAINFSINASAGTFHYYCEVHGSTTGGMDGVVKVRPITSAAPAGNPFTVTWALPATNTGNQFDVRFRKGTSGTWTIWRNDVAGRTGVFGMNGAPVQVMPGSTYQFQARSQKVPTQPSGWSPSLTVHT